MIEEYLSMSPVNQVPDVPGSETCTTGLEWQVTQRQVQLQENTNNIDIKNNIQCQFFENFMKDY